jgi:hypothetical protein
MPRFTVIAESFINGILFVEQGKPGSHHVGDVIEYDGEPGPNLRAEGADAEVIVAALKQTPKAVADLVAKVRLHAATRGVPPSEANDDDLNEVGKLLPNKPSDDTMKLVREQLGLSAPDFS